MQNIELKLKDMSITTTSSTTALRILSYGMIFIGAAWLASVILLFEKSITPATTFVGMIASFLGLDVAKVLKATFDAPKNQFKRIRKFRYVFCLLIMLALYALCLVVRNQTDVVDTANMLTNGAFAIMALFLAVIGGNKILTPHHGKNSAKTPLHSKKR